MKTIISLASAITLGGFVLAFLTTSFAAGFYAIAFSAAFLLILAADYAPRTRHWEPRSLKSTPAPLGDHRLQLAA